MKKVLIFGNSGSGKSSLANKRCLQEKLAHLDLDTLAWQPSSPPVRRSLTAAHEDIMSFINAHNEWVIEGCYADLLEPLLPYSNEIIFMNLPVAACIKNAQSRPWEPHKYHSKEAQDNNLAMLIEWISQYPNRTDTFSQRAHLALYEKYTGIKTMHTKNPD